MEGGSCPDGWRRSRLAAWRRNHGVRCHYCCGVSATLWIRPPFLPVAHQQRHQPQTLPSLCLPIKCFTSVQPQETCRHRCACAAASLPSPTAPLLLRDSCDQTRQTWLARSAQTLPFRRLNQRQRSSANRSAPFAICPCLLGQNRNVLQGANTRGGEKAGDSGTRDRRFRPPGGTGREQTVCWGGGTALRGVISPTGGAASRVVQGPWVSDRQPAQEREPSALAGARQAQRRPPRDTSSSAARAAAVRPAPAMMLQHGGRGNAERRSRSNRGSSTCAAGQQGPQACRHVAAAAAPSGQGRQACHPAVRAAHSTPAGHSSARCRDHLLTPSDRNSRSLADHSTPARALLRPLLPLGHAPVQPLPPLGCSRVQLCARLAGHVAGSCGGRRGRGKGHRSVETDDAAEGLQGGRANGAWNSQGTAEQ